MPKSFYAGAVAALLAVSGLSHAGPPPVIDLPQIGNPADAALSPAEETQIGRQVASELYHFDYVLDDDLLGEYLSSVGWRLAANGSQNPPPFTFLLIADPRINAFALPGAYIGVNAGLLQSARSESELASVMAHEEAHVTQRHAARTADQSNVSTIATWLAVLAAIIAGSANPNVVIGALSLGQGISYNRQVSYTRSNEFEADRIGIRTLAASGYDPNAMADFFGRLEQQTRLYGNQLPEILQTHPVNTTRIAEAEERAAQYPHVEIKPSVDFALMRARVRVLMADSYNDAFGYFAEEVRGDPDNLEARYGLALALNLLGRQDQALATLQPAVVRYPDQVTVQMLYGQVLIAAHHTPDGLAVLKKTLAQMPRFPPAIFAYADALTNAGQPDQAREVLLSHDQALGRRMDTFRLLAAAARASGDNAEAQYEQANYLAARGDLRAALQQLSAGLRIASLSTQDRARLSARRRELINSVPRDELERMKREPG